MKNLLFILITFFLSSCTTEPHRIMSLVESDLPELKSLGEIQEKRKSLVEDQDIEFEISQDESENVVHIRGLGDYNDDDLFKVATYVNKFFGYVCIVEEGVPTNSKMYFNEHDLDVSQCISELSRQGVKTIYITNENVVNKGQQLRGGTFLRCNTVIVEHSNYDESTVLHEIGHTLGLVHCDNLECLMAINNDFERRLDFCDKCKKQLKNYENIQ